MKLVEQPREFQVVAVVHHDEAGVDGLAARLGLHAQGVRMSAESIRILGHVGLGLPVQQMSGDQSRHAGANDCDLHPGSSTRESGVRFNWTF